MQLCTNKSSALSVVRFCNDPLRFAADGDTKRRDAKQHCFLIFNNNNDTQR